MTVTMWLVIVIAFAVFVTGCTLVIGTHNKVDTKIDREVGIGLEVSGGDEKEREVRSDEKKAHKDRPRSDNRRSADP